MGAIRGRLPLVLCGCMFLLTTAGDRSAAQEACVAGEACAEADKARSGEAVSRTAGENAETEASDSAPSDGFTISVDGDYVAGDKPSANKDGDLSVNAEAPLADRQRATDVALEQVDVQIKFDGIGVQPVLNVSTADLKRAYRGGETVGFLATSNYPAWIDKAEIRILRDDRRPGAGPKVYAVVPVDAAGEARWTVPARDETAAGSFGEGVNEGDGAFVYVLRVYDGQGRFDETKPRSLVRSSGDFERHAVSGEPVSPGNGEDNTASRNIPVEGGAVTVYGRNIPSGYTVRALGETIPVDAGDKFVVQRILPPGDHVVDVAVSGGKSNGVSFGREINIPDNEWFYVALADLTVGKRFSSAAVEAADPGRYDDVYTKGRLAFYLKGKIKGKYLLTAAADTGEDDIENLFRGLDAKNPRQLLRRIDPDDYYPVYGDDSVAIEDAPTSGKFYVRIDRGDSHVMWGNFKSRIEGNGLLRNERALYGANAAYRSPATTSFGERKLEATAYAAQPGTLPQRDVFRGTGGSAYFLKRQDLTRGSETITVVVTDPLSGRVISRQTLVAGEDYDIDYVQGIVILRRPLSSSARDTGPVRQGAVGDNNLNLVVNYEYTPAIGEVDGYSYGGRIQGWFADHVRIGVTGMSEETGPADQQMIGADVRLRMTERTYLEADYARTRGPGFGRSLSTDGGLTIEEEAAAGRNRQAEAFRLKAQADLSDFDSRWSGSAGAYFERKEAGFSTLDSNITSDQTEWGANISVDVTGRLTFGASHDFFENGEGTREAETKAEIGYDLTDSWRIVVGAGYLDLATPKASSPQDGSRFDVGARIEYAADDDQTYYAFGQATVSRSGDIRRNDRYGLGANVKLTEKVGLEGEISHGTTGIGGLAAITYDPTADDHYYFGYKLDPDRAFDRTDSIDLYGSDLGGIVLGARRRYGEFLSAHAENNYDMFGKRRSLTSTYGVTYTPDAVWTVSGGLELGRVADPNGSDFDRYAPSLSVGYRNGEDIAARLRAEVRFEDSDDDTRDRQTYLLSSNYSNKLNDDWRLLLNGDLVISNSDQSSVRDGDYAEASVGFAYRPVANDRLNALFKYTFLFDLPGPDQVARSTATVLGPAQRSHVVSADFIYDLNRYLSVGAKYGFRYGEVSTTRTSGDFVPSSAHLGILRADLHVVNNWDLLLEGRVLHLPEAGSTDYGALTAVYRHFGENMKAGVGYNFGRFSDDLTDLTLDDQGVFLNVIGKF